MRFFYNIFVSLLIFGMKLGAAFNYKLKRGLAGRKQSCNKVKSAFSTTDKVIWMHAASLGEYEQGLPVLEQLKSEFPKHKILITFFSPSGYEIVVKKNKISDVVCYLPFDKMSFIKDFMSNFTTDIFITVKYEFWYNLLEELKNQKAKVYVISALFYETQLYFKPYGSWFLKELNENVNWFFHQTHHSSAIAKSIGLINSSTAGDTRFDRVKALTERNNSVPRIAEFKNNQPLIVIGSSWAVEERIAELIIGKNSNVKIIIAPHDILRTDSIRKIFPKAILYSDVNDNSSQLLENAQVLIIDSIGLLSKLYSYADLAIVGGGFHSKGLHNVLEAAAFGVPVYFGNHYTKNPEADALIAKNGGKGFEDEFFAAPFIIDVLEKPEILKEEGDNAYRFVHNQPNSTEIILQKIMKDFSY